MKSFREREREREKVDIYMKADTHSGFKKGNNRVRELVRRTMASERGKRQERENEKKRE